MMPKEQFLACICDRLAGLPQEDRERSLDYYREMIEDRMEEGLSEEEAVSALGSVDDIVSQILLDTPLPKLVKAKVSPRRTLKTWESVLLVLGSPLWLPLVLTAALMIFSLYFLLWTLVVSMYAVLFSFAVAALGGIIGVFFLLFSGDFPQAALFFGFGLICAGVTVLLFFAFNAVTKSIVGFSGRVMLKIKSRLVKVGGRNG